MKYLDKQGITPLMITLLLISFAVALGVVIMNFGRAEVESEAECPINIGMKLSSISGVEQLCYDQAKQQLSFTVENGVNINVEGLIVNLIGELKAETIELAEAKMGKAGIYMGRVAYDKSTAGEIRQIKISPKILLYDNEEICAEKAVVAESVRAC
ncbi:MAG: hypothetical protein AABW48_03770 [Nanoarchaeota archaeon]